MSISDSTRLWLYFLFLIPSIPCSIFVLCHLLTDRILRRALNNHVIIIILSLGLFYELTDVIWFIHYYRVGMALIQTPGFCLTWVFIDVGLFITITILVAWASIERHILIFHDNWIATARGRLLFHYIPCTVFLVYPIIFYIFIYYIIPCEQPLMYNIMRCGYSFCAIRDPIIGKFDSIVNNIIPTFTIVLFGFLLLVRVIWQKCRLNQQVRWRNYRKMAIQLLSVSSIYLFVYFPSMIFYVLYSSNVSLSDTILDYYGSSLYFIPHIVMIIPFTTAFSLPELRAKLKINILCWRRPIRAIDPQTLRMRRTNTVRPATQAQS